MGDRIWGNIFFLVQYVKHCSNYYLYESLKATNHYFLKEIGWSMKASLIWKTFKKISEGSQEAKSQMPREEYTGHI